MIIEEMIDVAMAEFRQNVRALCQDEAEGPLTPASAELITQGIKRSVQAAGSAALRTYLESKDEQRDIIRVNGEVFRFKFLSEKTFTTPLGQMPALRRLYQNASDTQSYVPLDAAWDMEGKHVTIEVQEALNFACGQMTPEETHALLNKSALFHPHPTVIKRVVEQTGDFIASHREELDRRIHESEKAPEGTRVLATSMDGANLLVKNEENETGQAQAAQEEEGHGKTRAAGQHSPDDAPRAKTEASSTEQAGKGKASAYKNAMVGTFSFYGEVKGDKKVPQRLDCRYTSHMPEERWPTFRAKFEAELDAAEAQCPQGVPKVILCDGARPIWNYVDNDERFDGYEKLVDYRHTREHLKWASEALFGKDTDAAKAWLDKYAKKLAEDDNGARSVLRSMDYHAKTRKLSTGRLEALEKERTFFRRNKHRMTYADFRRRGFPIGSGPVEAACKTLVKTRLCRSGMRWSLQGGQRILDLRTYIKSNRWDDFWEHYKQLSRAS